MWINKNSAWKFFMQSTQTGFINVYGVKDGAAAGPLQALDKGITAIPLSLRFLSFPLEYTTISMLKQRACTLT
jgi:hypothetical protein